MALRYVKNPFILIVRFLLPIFLFAPNAVASNQCHAVFEFSKLIEKCAFCDQISKELEVVFEKVANDHPYAKKDFDHLVKETGNKIAVEVNGPVTFIDGMLVHKINGTGENNGGVYYARTPEGKNVVYKLLKYSPEEFLRELYFSIRAKQLSAAQILGFGEVETNIPAHYYIKMTHIADGHWGETLKDLKHHLIREEAREFLHNNMNPAFKENLIQSIAQNFVEVYLRNLAPRDPDFVVDKFGYTRWIDFALWNIARSSRDISPYVLQVKEYLDEIEAGLGKRFIDFLGDEILKREFAEDQQIEIISDIISTSDNGLDPAAQNGAFNFDLFKVN